jgi:hypothetical protein
VIEFGFHRVAVRRSIGGVYLLSSSEFVTADIELQTMEKALKQAQKLFGG